jgi:hypothetical protein
MVRRPCLCLLFVGLTACDLALPEANVCFSKHVVPLVQRDCAPCHGNGEYHVAMEGTIDDYAELSRLSWPDDPHRSSLLAYAAGLNQHPVIWPASSGEYRSVAAWMTEGARLSCRPLPGDAGPDSLPAYDSGPAKGGVEGDAGFDGGPDGSAGNGADSRPKEGENEEKISFGQDIVPLLRRDCASCHSYGQYGIRIAGDTSDYAAVMGYVDLQNPEEYGGFLWWAAGGRRHPISWPRGGIPYNLFLQWVLEGGNEN